MTRELTYAEEGEEQARAEEEGIFQSWINSVTAGRDTGFSEPPKLKKNHKQLYQVNFSPRAVEGLFLRDRGL